MTYDRSDAPVAMKPIRSAMSAALDELTRCENLILELSAHLHPGGPSQSPGSKPATTASLPTVHLGANEIAQRTAALGDMLSELCSSF